MSYDILRNSLFNTLLDLTTDKGINASGKDDVYGCIFGRDSAITVLKMLRVYENTNDVTERERIIEICRRALLTLISLQGKETNIESGEEPGSLS